MNKATTPYSGRFISEDGSVINIAKAFNDGEDTGLKENIDAYSPITGRLIAEDGSVVNVADKLRAKGEDTGLKEDVEAYRPITGRLIAEDGSVINIAKAIGEGDSGEGYVNRGLLFDLRSISGFSTFISLSNLSLVVTDEITIEWRGTITGLSTTDSGNPNLGRLFAFRTGESPAYNGFEALIEKRNDDYYLGFGVNNNWIGGPSFINHFGAETTVPTDTEFTLSVTVNGEGFNIYRNGELLLSSDTYQSAFKPITYIYAVLMSNYPTGTYQGCSGNVKSLRLYGRALTAGEISDNAKADRNMSEE